VRGKYLKHVTKYGKNFGTCVMRNFVECGFNSKNKIITLQSEEYYEVCHKLCVRPGIRMHLVGCNLELYLRCTDI